MRNSALVPLLLVGVVFSVTCTTVSAAYTPVDVSSATSCPNAVVLPFYPSNTSVLFSFDTDNTFSNTHTSCASVYEAAWLGFNVPACTSVSVSTDDPRTAFDTVLAIFGPFSPSSECSPFALGSPDACDDNSGSGTTSVLSFTAAAGASLAEQHQYFVAAGGQDSSSHGAVGLELTAMLEPGWVYDASCARSPCPQGSFCVQGVASLCPVGTFSNATGRSSCTTCPSGLSSPRGAMSCGHSSCSGPLAVTFDQELAASSQTVELALRNITVHNATWLSFTPSSCGMVSFSQSPSTGADMVVAAVRLSLCDDELHNLRVADSTGILVRGGSAVSVLVGFTSAAPLVVLTPIFTEQDCFGATTIASSGLSLSAVIPTRLDGDGDLDLVMAPLYSQSVLLYDNVDGLGTFSATSRVLVPVDDAASTRVADLDGDGDQDLVVLSRGEDTLLWFENVDGRGAFSEKRVIDTVEVVQGGVVIAADLDSDGDQDVVVALSFGGQLFWYENVDGKGTFASRRVVDASVSGVSLIVAADVSGDGELDLICNVLLTDRVVWFKNYGNRTFSEARDIPSTARDPVFIVAADLDADGDQDVVVAYSIGNTIAWFEHVDGDGTFSSPRVLTSTASYATSVAAVDMDGDGDLDILWSASSDSTVAYFENHLENGVASFATAVIVSSVVSGVRGALGPDLNGDGVSDVLSFTESSASWHENRIPAESAPSATAIVRLVTSTAVSMVFTDVLAVSVSWTVDAGCLLSPPTHADLLESAADLVIESGDTLVPNTTYCVHAAVADRQGRVGRILSHQFTTLNADSDAFLRSLSLPGFRPEGDTFEFTPPVNMSPDEPVVAHFAPLASATLVTANGSRAIASGQSLPLPRLVSVVRFQLVVTSGDGSIQRNYSVVVNRFASYLLPLELLVNPTRTNDSLIVNSAPTSALKFIDLTLVGEAPSVRSVVLAGAVDANLTHLLPLAPGARVLVVKNAPALRARFVLPGSAIIVEWSSGDLWADADHGAVRLLVDGVEQWSFTFEPNAAYAAAASGGGQSLVISNELAWEASGSVMSSMERVPLFAYGVATTPGLWAGATFAEGQGSQPVIACPTCSEVGCLCDLVGSGGERLDLRLAEVQTISVDGVEAVAVADVSGDGFPDIVTASGLPTDKLMWYRNDGNGSFVGEPAPIGLSGAESVVVADVSGDGMPDVLVVPFTTKVEWYSNAGGNGTFSGPRVISSSLSSVFLAFVANITGGEHPDVVVAAWDAVYFFPGEGNNAFGEVRTAMTTTQVIADATAVDIDGDGDMDIVVGTRNDHTVVWYENLDGEGTFSDAHGITTEATFVSTVVAADVNGDNHTDLVVATLSGVDWFQNDGSGVLSGPHSVRSGGANSVFAVDVDHDGDLDLLLALASDKLVLLKNLDGLGSFGEEQTVIASIGTHSSTVGAADLDLDGDFDVIASSKDDDVVSIVRNVGSDPLYCTVPSLERTTAPLVFDGVALDAPLWTAAGAGFTPNATEASACLAGRPEPRLWALGNFFGGTEIELAVVPSDSSNFLVYNRSGPASFGDSLAVSLSVPVSSITQMEGLDCEPNDCGLLLSSAQPTELLLLRHDGSFQLTTAHTFDSNVAAFGLAGHDIMVAEADGIVTWLEASSSGTMEVQRRFDPFVGLDAVGSVQAVTVGDLTGTSFLDLVLVADARLLLLADVSSPAGVFEFAEFVDSTLAIDEPASLFVADVDGDGRLDVGTTSAAYTGRRLFSGSRVITVSANDVIDLAAADLTGDGSVDIVVASAANLVSFYENVDRIGTFSDGQVLTSSVSKPVSVDVGDLDGDGDVDVVVASEDDSVVVWFENLDGNGTFSDARVITSSVLQALAAVVADIDGDGDKDVLVVARNGNTPVAWYSNDGSGSFAGPHAAYSAAASVTAVHLADLDGDNDLDLLVASSIDPVAWFENDGAGTFSFKQSLSTTIHSVTFLATADLDGDGTLDVVVSSVFHGVRWFKNDDGKGSFFTAARVLSTLSAVAVVTVDLDDDGDTDVLAAHDSQDQLIWYLNDGDGSFSSLQTVSSTVEGVTSVLAVDVDADGDLDIVAGVPGSASVLWFPNRAQAFPDSSTSLACDQQGAWGATGYVQPCTLVSRRSGQLVAASASSFGVVVSDGATVSALSPGFSSVFLFDVLTQERGQLLVTDSATGVATTFQVADPPRPVIVEHSLRALSGGTGSGGRVDARGSTAVRVALNVSNLVLSNAVVTYGPSARPQQFECRDVSIELGSVSTVQCSTQGQEALSEVVPLYFQVTVLDVSSAADLTNSLHLTPAPQVTRVTGCDEDDVESGSTSGCPLDGGIPITVFGERFGLNGSTTVTIGGRLCQLTAGPASSTNLTCLLPASSGGRQLISPATSSCDATGAVTVVYGTPLPLVAYRVPSVVGLFGCRADASGSLALVDCERAGEDVTIVGVSFGSVSAGLKVTVGSQPCEQLREVSVQDVVSAVAFPTDASALACRLPSSNLIKQALLVLDPSGQPSQTQALVSYRQCKAGERNNGTLCDECAPGKFSDEEGVDGCTPCRIGRFANATGLSVCSQCTGGSIAAEIGASECEPCVNGTIADAGVQCVPCSIGKYSSDPSDASCSLCAAGSFAEREGMSACELCSSGKAQEQEGQASCLNCTQGRYAGEPGMEQCKECVGGSVAGHAGAVVCEACVNGTIAEAGAQCRPCAVGKHSSDPSDASCALCGAGSFAGREGMSACELCSTGKAQEQQGQASCLSCTQGRYASAPGMPTCERCPDGHVAELGGASECAVCPGGTIAVAGTQCRACEIGKYSSDPTDAVCTPCPKGSVAPGAGFERCDTCPPGRFASIVGQGLCTACPQGTYTNTSGSGSCTECPENLVAPSEKSVQCTECPLLQYTRGTGKSRCASCPSGEYVLFEEQPEGTPTHLRQFKDCVDCPPGSTCSGDGTVVADEAVWVVQSADGSVSSFRCLPGRCEQCSTNASVPSSSAALACCAERRAPAEDNPMCARCADGYIEWANECIECEETNVPLLIALFLLLWAMVCIMHTGLNQQSNSLSLIFFYYVQMVLLLFGEETAWLAWASFFNFNPVLSASGGQCVAPWSSLTQLAVSALSPFLTWVFLGLTAAIHASINACRRHAGLGVTWKEMTAPYLRSCLAFFLLAYNNVASSSLRFFECMDVADGRWLVVRSAPEIDCESDEYANVQPLFVGCLVAVAVCPLVLLYWLMRPRLLRLAGVVQVDKGPSPDAGTPYAHVWGAVFEMYEGAEKGLVVHLWNVVVLVRRVAIIGVSVVALKFGHRTKYAALTVIHTLVLLMHLVYHPFRRMSLDGVFLDSVIGGQQQPVSKIVVNVNALETVSLLLLVMFSAVIGAIDPPFKDGQSIVLALFVFAWMAVLMSVVLGRVVVRRRAKIGQKRGKHGSAGGGEEALHMRAGRGVPQTELVALPAGGMAPSSSHVQYDEDVEDGELEPVSMRSSVDRLVQGEEDDSVEV